MKLFNDVNTKQSIKNIVKIITIIVAIISIGFNSLKQVIDTKEERQYATYNKKLEGYFSYYGDSIEYITNRIKDKKIFSLYASAVETVTNQFQPTGIDYIIHVLGDKQREEYLEKFKEENFEYVADLNKKIPFKYWVRNSNWFFYRELYKNYKPTFESGYNIFFDKKQEKQTDEVNINIKTNKKDDSTYIIEVETEDKNYDGIADVCLSYKSSFKKNLLKSLDINRYVYVHDLTTESYINANKINYNIPNESEEYYIPITIINGKGKVEITTYPQDNTTLEISKVEVIDTYDVIFKYCSSTKNMIGGKNKIYVDLNQENKIILQNVKAVKINGITEKVLNYKQDGTFIILEVEKNGTEFAYPNFFEVIK